MRVLPISWVTVTPSRSLTTWRSTAPAGCDAGAPAVVAGAAPAATTAGAGFFLQPVLLGRIKLANRQRVVTAKRMVAPVPRLYHIPTCRDCDQARGYASTHECCRGRSIDSCSRG